MPKKDFGLDADGWEAAKFVVKMFEGAQLWVEREKQFLTDDSDPAWRARLDQLDLMLHKPKRGQKLATTNSQTLYAPTSTSRLSGGGASKRSRVSA